MNVARAITRNLGARILALVVAVLVWFNASGQEPVVRVRTAPLVVEGLPDSLALAAAVPVTAEVRVSATRRQLVTVGFRRLSVAADLTGFGPGRHRVLLTAAAVRGLGGIDPAGIQVVSPAQLDIDIEPVATRRVQVLPVLVGTLPPHLLMLPDGLQVEPAWVTVRGAASALDRVHHVPTEPIDLSRVRESTERDVVIAADHVLLACDPERVTVTLHVSERGERVLANVPPTVLLDADDVDFDIEPPALSLTLEGPSAVLDTLSSGDVSVLLTLTGRAPDTYRMAPDVILPGGVRVSSMSADTLIVRLFRVPR